MEDANTPGSTFDSKDNQFDRLADWVDQLCMNAFSLLTRFEALDDGGVYASVFVLPKIAAAEGPGRRNPFHYFAGELYGNRAEQLRSALKSIGVIYGVDDKESLAIMGQTLLLLTAIHQLKAGQTPTLSGPLYLTEFDPPDSQAYVEQINRPRLSTEEALEVWLTMGAGIDLRQIWKPPLAAGSGRLFYYSFPPIWLPKEKIDRLHNDRSEGLTLPLQVNSEFFAAVESFSKLLDHTQQTGLPMELMVASPGQPIEEKVPPGVPRIDLTEDELIECDRYQFKGGLPIEITGQVVARKSNEVKIDGASVNLTDAEFVLFLRLVVALFESDDGYVDRSTLSGSQEEDVYAPEFIDQALYRLRAKLKPVSQGLDARKYVEVHNKRIRLSTHRKYIQANRSLLLGHQFELIRNLAGRLPEG